MYTLQPKKLMIINILDILNKYTDSEHRLSQRQIQERLESEYQMKADRKAVRRNLMNLIDFGYPIEYSETLRRVRNAKTGEYEDTVILSDFYIERDFDNAEIRLLIDSIIFSRHIPAGDKKRLIEKLEGLSNVFFKSQMKHVAALQEQDTTTNAVFYTIDILDEAISKGRQVKFHYDEYRSDKRLHHRLDSDGNVREYLINPYQIVASGGRYYLLCNYDKYNKLSNYRLDRISDIELLDTPAKPIQSLDGMKGGLDLSKHMREHIYMFADKTVRAKFVAGKHLINDIIDNFGTSVRFSDETEATVTVTATVSEQDMLLWAMQFATQVTVLEPQELAEECRNRLRSALTNYEQE